MKLTEVFNDYYDAYDAWGDEHEDTIKYMWENEWSYIEEFWALFDILEEDFPDEPKAPKALKFFKRKFEEDFGINEGNHEQFKVPDDVFKSVYKNYLDDVLGTEAPSFKQVVRALKGVYDEFKGNVAFDSSEMDQDEVSTRHKDSKEDVYSAHGVRRSDFY